MDRRTIWAILLMMVIAIAPAIFMKKAPAGQRGSGAVASTDSSRTAVPDSLRSPPAVVESAGGVPPDTLPGRPAAPLSSSPTDDTVHVTSPLYTYAVSTRGGRLVEATLYRYGS